MLELGFTLESTKGRLISGKDPGAFSGVGTDSRKVGPGEVFFALRGDNYDGHRFVDEALSKGAAGAVIEGLSHIRSRDKVLIEVPSTLTALGDLASAWRLSFPALKLAAITGSNGKTTTKEMSAAIVSLKFPTLKNSGNFNNLVGLPLTLLGLDDTYAAAVVELGMNDFGEIKRLSEIARPDIGVITNIGRAHLEKLGGIDGVARAKGELVEGFDEDRTFVVNLDDPRVEKIASGVRCRKLTYGIKSGSADITARGIEQSGFSCIEFTMRAPGMEFPVRLKGIGLHNVMNALSAAGIGLSFGCGPEEIKEGLEGFTPGKMRLEILQSPAGFGIINDTYNANPDSLRSAIDEVVRLRGSGRSVVVVGDMLELGDASEAEHRALGEYLSASGVDLVIAYGKYGRALLEGAGGVSSVLAKTHEEAANAVTGAAGIGDIVLVKGSRGMRMEEVTKILLEGV